MAVRLFFFLVFFQWVLFFLLRFCDDDVIEDSRYFKCVAFFLLITILLSFFVSV